jgi:ankyrin repeat protein
LIDCYPDPLSDRLIEALRARDVAAVRSAIRDEPKKALQARSIVEASRLAFRQALELFHKNGADLNAIWRGYRPLHSLIQENPHDASGEPGPERLACLDWLLEHGADPEQLAAWPPARAILVAAFAGRPEYVKHLRKAGAKLDGFVGAALGDPKMVEKALVKHPGFARDRDSGGLTALQCAAGTRLPAAKGLDIARLLIDNGAEIDAETQSWSHAVTAIYFAASAKNKPMFELLLDRGASAAGALVPALWNATPEFADLALRHGAVLDEAVSEGKPLLNHLICWGQIPATLWMLAHGASPNLSDERGWTAVHQAASRGNARMMQAVLDAGGDLKRRNKDGHTPLDVALAAGRDKLVAMMNS